MKIFSKVNSESPAQMVWVQCTFTENWPMVYVQSVPAESELGVVGVVVGVAILFSAAPFSNKIINLSQEV